MTCVLGSWIIVMMQGPGVVVQLVWTFVLNVFPHSSHIVIVDFTIHRLSWWNIFLTHDAFNVKNPSTLI